MDVVSGDMTSLDAVKPDSPTTAGSIVARIERLPRNGMLVRARLLVGTATFFDGFDVIAIAATLPVLVQKWGLTQGQVGLLIAAGSIGQLIGALLFPIIAERFGRLKAIAWSAGLIGLASIACGFAPSFAVFTLLRTIQGLGLGGELPVAATYINEITKARGRGRFVLLYEIVFPIGLLASNALGAWIVPRLGWQAMYFLGSVPLVLFFLLSRLIPESPRWLVARGRISDADRAISVFEKSVKGELPALTEDKDWESLLRKHPKRRIRELFGPLYLKRTISVALLWITSGVIQYGLATWLPTIFRSVYHAPLQLALNLTVATSVFTVVGALCCALLVDVVGRKPVINVSFLLCAIALGLAGAYHDHSIYLVAILCAFALGLMGSGFMTAYVYTPELYPTSIRAMGCGVGSAWLKVAAIVAPAATGALLQAGQLQTVFLAFALVPLVGAVVIHFFSIETNGRVLEELEV
ncbi:MFS transporter [Paraburkholderia terrae]|uniref:MFS transporter n=2 Tax=Burkholderiaceae TaxID=119060 RepID=UPI002085BDF4|nr:MFS transporter [Paraburkholderia sp. 22B1P]GJH07082.1 MFS transporter [Paraburkholderia terrae]GJH39405.1 MFS transporter [Paraburkholderia hospita]